MRGGAWNRAKRLALSFAKSKTSATSRAPGFQKATLVALERCVMDGFLPKTERVACGKLRLCIQSSTRYDDILNTPLAAWREGSHWPALSCTAGKDRSTLVGCFPERCLRGEWQLAAHADVLGIGKSRGHLAFRRSLRQIAIWQ